MLDEPSTVAAPMSVSVCPEPVVLLDESEPLELAASSSSYSAALMLVVAERVRATVNAHPPPTLEEAQRLRAWCSELEDASVVLGAEAEARPRSVAARF
jgi:hypothetical protein